MRNLILALLVLLFAAPALAHGGQPRVLLASTHIYNTLPSINSLGYCFSLGTDYYVFAWCAPAFGGYHAPRDVTITEIEVITVTPTGDQTGHCAVNVVEDTNGDETWDEVIYGPYYVNATGAAGAGYSSRHAVDIDVERGAAIGFTINNWTGVPSQCNSENTDPVFQLFVWGYYTD